MLSSVLAAQPFRLSKDTVTIYNPFDNEFAFDSLIVFNLTESDFVIDSMYIDSIYDVPPYTAPHYISQYAPFAYIVENPWRVGISQVGPDKLIYYSRGQDSIDLRSAQRSALYFWYPRCPGLVKRSRSAFLFDDLDSTLFRVAIVKDGYRTHFYLRGQYRCIQSDIVSQPAINTVINEESGIQRFYTLQGEIVDAHNWYQGRRLLIKSHFLHNEMHSAKCISRPKEQLLLPVSP